MQGKKTSGSLAGLRLRGSYTLAQTHVFDLQFNGRLRFAKGNRDIGKELQIVAGYNYRFHLDPEKLKLKAIERKKERQKKKNAKLLRYNSVTPSW